MSDSTRPVRTRHLSTGAGAAMAPHPAGPSSTRRHAPLIVALAMALLGGTAHAQAIYRIVGADGKISFSDKPPAQGNQASALGASGRAGASPSTADMPFEVREAVGRYPVTLYTGDSCDPCASARNLLTRRGVPFTERTLTTADDVEALKKLGMDATVPLATIGSQRLKGFSEEEWNLYLDAAGYPRSSRLPASYRNPPASPLAPPVLKAAAPQPTANGALATPAPPSAPPVGPTPDNPAGIVF